MRRGVGARYGLLPRTTDLLNLRVKELKDGAGASYTHRHKLLNGASEGSLALAAYSRYDAFAVVHNCSSVRLCLWICAIMQQKIIVFKIYNKCCTEAERRRRKLVFARLVNTFSP